MATGVYKAKRKDGVEYYRSNIHYKNKNISLGSYNTFDEAHEVHVQAKALIKDMSVNIPEAFEKYPLIPFDKAVSLVNYRNFKLYFGVPIYLNKLGFSYYLDEKTELKFDNDDLFYYADHRIMKRGGHLYVNDYGSQVNILSRYGIKNHAVAGVDYLFVNKDSSDYRYENIKVINPYYGVSLQDNSGRITFMTKIHIIGNYQIGIYNDMITAAIAYNKAVDMAKAAGITKEYTQNFPDIGAKEFAEIYSQVHISRTYRDYLKTLTKETIQKINNKE